MQQSNRTLLDNVAFSQAHHQGSVPLSYHARVPIKEAIVPSCQVGRSVSRTSCVPDVCVTLQNQAAEFRLLFSWNRFDIVIVMLPEYVLDWLSAARLFECAC
jgi:hypothetical protein